MFSKHTRVWTAILYLPIFSMKQNAFQFQVQTRQTPTQGGGIILAMVCTGIVATVSQFII